MYLKNMICLWDMDVCGGLGVLNSDGAHFSHPKSLTLPFKGVILTDGLDESFIRTFDHNKCKTRIWGCAKLFRSNLDNETGC